MHSPDHSTKGTPLTLRSATLQWPLTACACVVSGSLSSPSRGAFHLSLTVLFPYRSPQLFSLGGWSPQLPTRLHVSRGTQVPARFFTSVLNRTLTFSGRAFQLVRVVMNKHRAGPTTPIVLSNHWFRLFPVRSPLLRESRLISFRQATEMFQFAYRPPFPYLFRKGSPDITLEGLPHSDPQGSSLAGSSP